MESSTIGGSGQPSWAQGTQLGWTACARYMGFFFAGGGTFWVGWRGATESCWTRFWAVFSSCVQVARRSLVGGKMAASFAPSRDLGSKMAQNGPFWPQAARAERLGRRSRPFLAKNGSFFGPFLGSTGLRDPISGQKGSKSEISSPFWSEIGSRRPVGGIFGVKMVQMGQIGSGPGPQPGAAAKMVILGHFWPVLGSVLAGSCRGRSIGGNFWPGRAQGRPKMGIFGAKMGQKWPILAGS